MSSDEAELRVAWHEACGRGRAAARVLEAVLERHREPHRQYHSVRHVVWVVRHVRELAAHEPVDDVAALVVAACFHDAVYRPGASDDEEASARLAQRHLSELGWPRARAAHVADLVRATAHLTDQAAASSGGPDTAVLVDADLAVLGAEPAAYAAYVHGVRAEYAHVPDAAWRTGRAEVLRAFLERPSIFRTGSAIDWWEHRARANLAAELATLTS